MWKKSRARVNCSDPGQCENSSASRQKYTSMVMEIRQARTLREYQSTTAVR